MKLQAILSNLKRIVGVIDKKELICNSISDYYGDLVCVEVDEQSCKKAATSIDQMSL